MSLSATVLQNRLISRARLRQLLLFSKTAELGSLKLAAQVVGMAQPSATQSLAELEDLIEKPLFLRHARGMTPTAIGLELLPLVRRMLDIVDEGATRLAIVTGHASSHVRIAALPAAIAGLLRDALPGFCRSNPSLSVEVDEADGPRLLQLIARREVDLAICRRPSAVPSALEFNLLLADRFIVVCGSSHPLADRNVKRSDLVGALWLSFPASIIARRAFDELFATFKAAPRLHGIVATSLVLLHHLLMTEQVLALVPKSLVEQELRAGAFVDLEVKVEMRLGGIGVLAPQADRTPAAEKLVAYLSFFAGAEYR